MKKQAMVLSVLLVLSMLLPPAALAAGGPVASAAVQTVEVDGSPVEFQMYALKDAEGNVTNYVKLRDVAHVLNGTPARFSVGWNGAISLTTGQPYTDTGTEMLTPFSGDREYRSSTEAIEVNGIPVRLEAIILTDDRGMDYTYFKLRDLGIFLGFQVDWTAERGVFLETAASGPLTDQTNLLLLILLYDRYQGMLGQAKRFPIQQVQGTWYGREANGAEEEIQVKDHQFLSVTCRDGVYRCVSATIGEASGASGSYRLTLRRGTTVTVDTAAGQVSASSWETSLRWFYCDPLGQSARGDLVAQLSPASGLQLYPRYQTALANAGG